MATWEAWYGPYVKLRVTATERDVQVANNRSWVRVESDIYYPGGTSTSNAFPQTLKVSVNGSNIGTQTGITYSLRSGGVKKLNGYSSAWITHNANGSKSVNVTVTITDGAGDSATINQTLALTTIARASTLSSAKMHANLVPSTENWVDLGLTRASSSFTHDISLMDGSTTIASWKGHGVDRWLSISGSQVNTLLKRMSTSTSKTLTLRVQTKSGSTNIGSALTKNLTATVDGSVVPSSGAVSYSISGTGVDSTMGLYVQGISKVYASFSPTAGYGATITSRSITIRKSGGNLDRQTVDSASGTFSKAVSYNGEYEVWGTVVDSRGRLQYTPSRFFTVQAYSNPSISSFTVARRASPQTTVDSKGSGKHSSLGGKNTLTIRIQWLNSAGSWRDMADGYSTSVKDTFTASSVSVAYDVATSYDLRLYISDSFGRTAIVYRVVSTQRVVLDIHKDEGVGIGKIHEQGVLDVDGRAYFKGDLYVNNVNQSKLQNLLLVINDLGITATDTISFWQTLPQGRYFVATGYIPNQPQNWGIIDHTTQNDGAGSDFNTIWYTQSDGSVYRKSGNGNSMSGWVPIDRPSGTSNSNGRWVEFNSGLKMMWVPATGGHTDPTHTWVFPKAFTEQPAVFVTPRQITDSASYGGISLGAVPSTTQVTVRKWGHGYMNYPLMYFAIGY